MSRVSNCNPNAAVICAATALMLLAAAPAADAGQEPVPIEGEPRHSLKFENAHVRFFDVELEPGYRALYHWHRNDRVFVNILPANTVAQDWGGNPSAREPRAIGETYFIRYSRSPKAHRVSNSDLRPYRVTDTEILSGCGGQAQWREGRNQTLILQNDRVFVTRVMLHPGESAELPGPCGMLVSVSGGDLVIGAPGETSPLTMHRAGFHWRTSRLTQTLTNAGSRVFQGVDIRIKR
ncbi:MAG: hypothetical protein WDZ63_12540 [Burkholderiales bacterium]